MIASPHDRLTRIRWAVRAVLALGVTASVCANVLHARPNVISQLIAAWSPLALQLTVELISRVPADRRVLAAMRLIAAGMIAGIAAWVSYWHMVGVASRYGETLVDSHLLPLSVDGLVVVASVSLVEIAGRLHRSNEVRVTESSPSPNGSAPERRDAGSFPPTAIHSPPRTGWSTSTSREARAAVRKHTRSSTENRQADPGGDPTDGRPHRTSDSSTQTQVVAQPPANTGNDDLPADHAIGTSSMPMDTAAAVAYWFEQEPALHPAEVASRIGRSERTVRRYWPPPQRDHEGFKTR